MFVGIYECIYVLVRRSMSFVCMNVFMRMVEEVCLFICMNVFICMIEGGCLLYVWTYLCL